RDRGRGGVRGGGGGGRRRRGGAGGAAEPVADDGRGGDRGPGGDRGDPAGAVRGAVGARAAGVGLAGGGGRPGGAGAGAGAIGGVGMIGDAASWVLGTLKRSLAATTVALLWLDEDGERVKLKEVVSDADDIPEAPRLSSAGILGAVVHDRQALLCAATKPGQ